VEAESIRLNTPLGMYTNFVNLLDLAAVVVPSGFRAQGFPMSITSIAPASHDDLLTSIAPAFQRRAGLRLDAIAHIMRRFPLAFSG
jgi:allophanate hydrolase